MNRKHEIYHSMFLIKSQRKRGKYLDDFLNQEFKLNFRRNSSAQTKFNQDLKELGLGNLTLEVINLKGELKKETKS